MIGGVSALVWALINTPVGGQSAFGPWLLAGASPMSRRPVCVV